MRGPEDRLDDLGRRIEEFVEAEKRDELERGFSMSFDFPQKYAHHLIGRRGENINKLREEFDIDIQVNEGKVELKGPKAKAEAAQARITAMRKKLDDEATHVLKIPPQYHKDMIGAKGSLVNRLQDRYSVRVQFPRGARDNRDDESVATGSDAGTPRWSRSNQAPDEVIVRGPRKGADEARDELLNLLQYTIDNSHTASMSVAQAQIPSLIGQGGREMDGIREATGAKIDIPNSREAADARGRVELKIKGTKKQVEDAKKLLQQKIKLFDESVTKSINVDKKYHKALIGTGGNV
jgi:predicted PilT family ATPase